MRIEFILNLYYLEQRNIRLKKKKELRLTSEPKSVANQI